MAEELALYPRRIKIPEHTLRVFGNFLVFINRLELCHTRSRTPVVVD